MVHVSRTITWLLRHGAQEDVHLIELGLGPDPGSEHCWSLWRRDISLYVFVDVPAAQRAGIEFLQSANGVILVESHIPPEFLTLVPQTAIEDRSYTKSPCYGFVVYTTDNRVLTVCTPSGHVGYPKGKKKKGEHGLQCAFRELHEETGLRPGDIQLTGEVRSESREDRNGVSTTYYYASTPKAHNVCPEDPEELDDAEWQTIETLLALPDAEFLPRRKALLPQSAHKLNFI